MIENISIALVVLFVILMVLFYFFSALYGFFEDVYVAVFNKPFYVHFYLSPKKLASSQVNILNQEFDFYSRLSPKRKVYFEHRVVVFLEKYPYHGKEDLVVTEQMRVLISATSIMLTFGMRKYIYLVFDKIILYPNEYYSYVNEAYHKGEFNPKMKALVFSWKHFYEGYETNNDNLNLGLHEFAHVLNFHGLRSTDISAVIFAKMYKKINKEVNHPPNREKLMQSDYFRDYAFTNQFEFFAVILEHYFETPDLFKSEFPQLYNNLSKMLNHVH